MPSRKHTKQQMTSVQSEIEQAIGGIQNMDLHVSKIIADYAKFPYTYKEEDCIIMKVTISELTYPHDNAPDDRFALIFYVDGKFFVSDDDFFFYSRFRDGKLVWGKCEDGNERKVHQANDNPEKWLLLQNNEDEDERYSVHEILEITPAKYLDKVFRRVKLLHDTRNGINCIDVTVFDRTYDNEESITIIDWLEGVNDEEDFPTIEELRKAEQGFLDFCLDKA